MTTIGRISSVALAASGLAGATIPDRVTTALELPPLSNRGTAEARAGFGGTFAALGTWALISKEPAAEFAVGVTWLGAAAARIAALLIDRPKTSWTYWAFLLLEIGLGAAAICSARARFAARPVRGRGRRR
jgi:hypothetical protein